MKGHETTIFDFMGNKMKYEFPDGTFSLEWQGEDLYVVIPDKGTFKTEGEYEIRDILETQIKKEIRFCNVCGKPFDAGFLQGDGEWYCCEEDFSKGMDEKYGSGNWKVNESGEEGEDGGYYEYLEDGEWKDTGIFYTEWY